MKVKPDTVYNIFLIAICTCLTLSNLQAQSLEPFEVNDDWVGKIREAAPSSPTVKPLEKRRMLVFSLHTGFYHWSIPHVNQVIKVLGEKSGAFDVELTTDVRKFSSKSLEAYDAVLLNNACSIGPRRDLILDALEKDERLSQKEREELAAKLEASLIEYVSNGGGLMLVHGSIVMQNNSEAFSDMAGGSFDYHPPQQEMTLELFDPDHPLVSAFNGATFTHVDEPYMFKNAYDEKNFRPLLYFDATRITDKREEVEGNISYVSWIKRHGKGRVFYVSPAHNAQSLEDPRMLKFYLDGAQYVLGDLTCDDSPAELK